MIELRLKTRLCAEELNYKLKKKRICISERPIGKVIKAGGLAKKYQFGKLKYKYVKVPLAKDDPDKAPSDIKNRLCEPA